ncbi:MAG: hypothetical protein C4K60_08510 [Ideonella sp. MAG2]|nr:MAG: hypothetical protein C4K60_08510 [Ideonella sp. MAG2]
MPFKPLDSLPHNRMIMALRESFLALMPLFILMQFVGFVVDLCTWAQWSLPWDALPTLRAMGEFLQFGWPLAMGLALTTHLARAFDVDPLVAAVLVLGVLLVAARVSAQGVGGLNQAWISLGAILLPMVGVWMLRFYLAHLPAVDTRAFAMISPALARTMAYILPFGLSFTSLAALIVFLPGQLQSPLAGLLRELPPELVLVLGAVLVNLLWWLGIHGSIAGGMLTDGVVWATELTPGTNVADLMTGVVYAGGSGCSLALALCLWWYLRDERDRRVLRWALPFAAFNINEPLLFGLPVVGQRNLLVPFVGAPLAGGLVALAALKLGWVEIQIAGPVPWMMPFGLNAWVLSPSPLTLIAVQVAVMGLAIMIYRPYVRAMAAKQSMTEFSRQLAEQLGVGPSQEPHAEGRYNDSVRALQATHTEAQEAMRLVSRGSLHLYYQPKMRAESGRIVGLEALLRLELPDGSVIGPSQFLPVLDRAGFGDMFDSWVLKQIIRDQSMWRAQDFECPVAVNLTAASLGSREAFGFLTSQLQGEGGRNIEVELLESSLSSDLVKVKAHLEELRGKGIKILVDDFGMGYSNLSVFHNAAVDVVKIDRSLLSDASEPRGQALYREICSTLARLGYRLVAEGVETLAEMRFVMACGVHDIQGFWISQPLRAEEVPGAIAGIESRLR